VLEIHQAVHSGWTIRMFYEPWCLSFPFEMFRDVQKFRVLSGALVPYFLRELLALMH
jgi:hypothetical protein